MSAPVDVLAHVNATPELVAELFWNLSDSDQAEFFAALDRLAGLKLCFQMASVIDVIRRRAERGDRGPMNGLRTMLSHADAYAESATDYRAWDALREVRALARVGGEA